MIKLGCWVHASRAPHAQVTIPAASSLALIISQRRGIYPSNYANLDDYFAAIKTKFNP